MEVNIIKMVDAGKVVIVSVAIIFGLPVVVGGIIALIGMSKLNKRMEQLEKRREQF